MSARTPVVEQQNGIMKLPFFGFCREWQTGKLCPQNAWCVSEVATVTLQLPDPHRLQPTSSGEYNYVCSTTACMNNIEL